MATRKNNGPGILTYHGSRHGEIVPRGAPGSRAQASALVLSRAAMGGPAGRKHGPHSRASDGGGLPREGEAAGVITSPAPGPVDRRGVAPGIIEPDLPTPAAAIDRVDALQPIMPAALSPGEPVNARTKPRRLLRDLAQLGPDDLLTPEEMCRYLNISDSTGRNWRLRGYGPEHIRVSARCLRYRKETVDAWLAARRVRSTSEAVGDA